MGFSVTRNTYTNTVEPIKTQDTFLLGFIFGDAVN
jgi:hypothetical protein